MMELDAFTTKLNHHVLGVEFCTGYIDKNGLVVKGFYCHREQMLFCCGNSQLKYCCNQAQKLAQQQLYNSEPNFGQTSVLNTKSVSMITLISASILTFIITVLLTMMTISLFQKFLLKKFRSRPICESDCINLNIQNNEPCRAIASTILPTTNTTAALLINNQNSNLLDQLNLSGPSSNCSSASTDQCTIETNNTMITNLSDTSLTNNSINLNTNLNNLTNLNSTNHFSSLNNALSFLTNFLTNQTSNNNQLNQENNSSFHISGSEQLNDLINRVEPPPPYVDNETVNNFSINLQIPTQFFSNELCN